VTAPGKESKHVTKAVQNLQTSESIENDGHIVNKESLKFSLVNKETQSSLWLQE